MNIETFDFDTCQWTSLKMETVFPGLFKMPKIVNCIPIQLSDDEILFVNERNSRTVLKNKGNKQLTNFGKLSFEDDFKVKGMPMTGVVDLGNVYIVSHGKSDSDYVFLHIGNVKSKTWRTESSILSKWT